jgi:hypothetical protein
MELSPSREAATCAATLAALTLKFSGKRYRVLLLLGISLIPCQKNLYSEHRNTPHAPTPITSPLSCYTFPSSRILYILLKPSTNSVHKNVGSGNHVITLTGYKCLQLAVLARGLEGKENNNQKWGTPDITGLAFLWSQYRSCTSYIPCWYVKATQRWSPLNIILK